MSDINKYLEKAEKYLQKGKPEAALEEYLQALDIDGSNENVRQNAADLAISLSRTYEAIAHLEWLFDLYYIRNEGAKALVTFRKLAKIAEPKPKQNFRCAELSEHTNRKVAAEMYEKALEGFVSQDQKADALECLKRLVALDHTVENLHRTSEMAIRLGEYTVAAAYLRDAGQLEVQEGGSGLASLGRAHQLDKANDIGALLYATALLNNGEPDTAAKVVAPFAQEEDCDLRLRSLYAKALLESNHPDEAYPLLWMEFQNNPSKEVDLLNLIDCFLVHDKPDMALEVAQRLQPFEAKTNRMREFATNLHQITGQHPPNAALLEYVCELLNSCSLEHDYCETLLQLYDLNYGMGQFQRACEALERAVQVDPYAAGHLKRLELLQGRVDDHHLRAIRSQIQSATNTVAPPQTTQAPATIDDFGAHNDELEPEDPDNPKVIEDFMLQAEIFLQYSMRSKALERLARIARLFPGEEQHNERLRRLYQSADFIPPIVPGAAKPQPPPEPQVPSPPIPAPTRPMESSASIKAANENAVDNFERVTEITRNIHRQPNIKSVLFTAVNDVGRHWNVSRCVAGLCLPGKPPSTALEYCAPGVPQSDVNSLVKLINTLQMHAIKRGPITLESAPTAPELESIASSITTLGIKSLMAIPLADGDTQSGILIWEQCGTQRIWRSLDVMVGKTIADQVTIALNNAKLRNLMKSLAVTEEQSGLVKRSSYIDVLQSEILRAVAQTSTTTVMLVSLDNSLRPKDLGESGVEAAIDKVAKAILPLMRQNDIAIRYNLTTVALLLPDTNGKNAFFVHEKVRKTLSALKIPGCPAELQINVGIAEALVDRDFDPVDIVTELINRAEAALVMARSDGGNKAHAIAPAYSNAVA